MLSRSLDVASHRDGGRHVGRPVHAGRGGTRRDALRSRFKDLDGDGARQASEPVLADQEIHLFSAVGPYLARSVTDTFGRYAFSDLSDGDYGVAYDAPSWWALRAELGADHQRVADADPIGVVERDGERGLRLAADRALDRSQRADLDLHRAERIEGLEL